MPRKKKMTSSVDEVCFKMSDVSDRLPMWRNCEEQYARSAERFAALFQTHFDWLREIEETVRCEMRQDEDNNNLINDPAVPNLPKTPGEKRSRKAARGIKNGICNPKLSIPPASPIRITRNSSRDRNKPSENKPEPLVKIAVNHVPAVIDKDDLQPEEDDVNHVPAVIDKDALQPEEDDDRPSSSASDGLRRVKKSRIIHKSQARKSSTARKSKMQQKLTLVAKSVMEVPSPNLVAADDMPGTSALNETRTVTPVMKENSRNDDEKSTSRSKTKSETLPELVSQNKRQIVNVAVSPQNKAKNGANDALKTTEAATDGDDVGPKRRTRARQRQNQLKVVTPNKSPARSRSPLSKNIEAAIKTTTDDDDDSGPKTRTRTRQRQNQSKAMTPNKSPERSRSPLLKTIQAAIKTTPKEATKTEVAQTGARYTRSRVRSALKQHASTSVKKTPTQKPTATRKVRTPSPCSQASSSKKGFCNTLYRHITHSNAADAINSFVVRNTPDKKHKILKDREMEERHEQQKKREEAALQKKDDLLRTKIEEQKRKREDRVQKVQAAQKVKQRLQEEAKRRFEQKRQAELQINRSPVKRSPYKLKRADLPPEDTLPKRMKMEEAMAGESLKEANRMEIERSQKEAEERKRREDERAELAERKLREKERIEREREELRKVQEKEKARQEQIRIMQDEEKRRVEEDRNEKEAESSRQKKLVAAVQKHNKTVAAPTKGTSLQPAKPTTSKSMNTSLLNASKQSYAMTPLRSPKPATHNNYDIDDLNSGDETDDDIRPRKVVPLWAQGGSLKSALIQQYYNPPDVDALFGVIKLPDLSVLFAKQRKRFKQRTSSAIWDSPLWNPRTCVLPSVPGASSD